MFNWFVKSPLTAEAAHCLYWNSKKPKPFTVSISCGKQKQLKQILNTIQKRAKIGYRALWVKELSEEIQEQHKELEYVIIKAFDGDSYYITW